MLTDEQWSLLDPHDAITAEAALQDGSAQSSIANTHPHPKPLCLAKHRQGGVCWCERSVEVYGAGGAEEAGGTVA